MNVSGHSLNISCPSFGANGQIPKKHTGFGEDISPQFSIDGLQGEVKTLVIIMDDLDVPCCIRTLGVLECTYKWIVDRSMYMCYGKHTNGMFWKFYDEMKVTVQS